MGTDSQAVVSAVRRANQAFYGQLSQTEPLDFGVAFYSAQFPNSPQVNQFRDFEAGGTPIAELYESVECFYSQRNLTCLRWVPALGSPIAPIEEYLAHQGWARRDFLAMAMDDWPDIEPAGPIRVLPARAMRKALRTTHLDPGDTRFSAATKGEQADESNERLNDSNYDVFVAMLDNVPAGRIGYHEVGDIASLRDLYVVSGARRRGVARALLAHVTLLARRLAPRIFVASVMSDDAQARACFERSGFCVADRLPELHRGAL